MPVYTYRREDGSTFEFRQKFSDDPLTVDPESGQRVTRVVHAAGVIFKGSGFYVNDSKGASKSSTTTPVTNGTSDSSASGTSDTSASTSASTNSSSAASSSTAAPSSTSSSESAAR